LNVRPERFQRSRHEWGALWWVQEPVSGLRQEPPAAARELHCTPHHNSLYRTPPLHIERCAAPSGNPRSPSLVLGAEVAPAAPWAGCIHGNMATCPPETPMEDLQAWGSVASVVARESQHQNEE